MQSEESLNYRIYYAARDGMVITLYALLADKSHGEIEEVLNKIVEDEGQKCSPLVIAARNGHDKVVRVLLSKFKPDVEQEGTVKFDGYVIEGASPLWCAAGAGHINVVKTLIKYGANVNHPTRTNSTPLRAACFDGRLDVVEYLTENAADIHIANKYNNTCLMIASYKGFLDIVTYLLKMGANPNVKALCGATALHFAAECGHVKIVKELLDHGGLITKNEYGMNPLVAAAERTRSDVVEFLIERPEFGRGERIEALELLGASFANDKDNYSLEKAYNYLLQGMKARYDDDVVVHTKSVVPRIAAYENHVECQCLEDLLVIQNSPHVLHMEGLVIRERVLGCHNPEVPHPIIFRGAVFADCAKFDKCVALWMHALKLRQENRLSVSKDLLRFTQVFSQMMHTGIDLGVECTQEILVYAVLELELNKAKLLFASAEEHDGYLEELESNMHTVLYLLVLTTKVLKRCSLDQEMLIYREVYKLNQLNLQTRCGQTLLHLTVNAATAVDDFHINDVCKFPCAATAKLLIQCGASVNATDNCSNTPLHLIVGYHSPVSDFMTLHSIIVSLIDGGTHMDTVNSKGETPFETATSGVAEIILRTKSELSLKCMAAKAVKKFNLSYEGKVPQALESFIELHGIPCMGYE